MILDRTVLHPSWPPVQSLNNAGDFTIIHLPRY